MALEHVPTKIAVSAVFIRRGEGHPCIADYFDNAFHDVDAILKVRQVF
jgi:hypothetical protein